MSALKVVIVGDTGVGKSALVERMRGKSFVSEHKETFGLNLSDLNLRGTELRILDFAGSEQNQSIVNQNLNNTTIALLCVDLSTQINPERLEGYISRIQMRSPKANFILVGTKEDSATEENKKKFSDMSFEAYHFEKRILTSSKTSEGIEELKKALFGLADTLLPQKPPAQDKMDDEEESDVYEQRPYSGLRQGELPEISAGFFFQVAQHPATGVVGGLLMLAGLLALGVGIACLCPALVPVLAGIGIALSQSAATSAVIAGGSAMLLGTMTTFFYKKATDDRIAGIQMDDNDQIDSNAEDNFPESSGVV